MPHQSHLNKTKVSYNEDIVLNLYIFSCFLKKVHSIVFLSLYLNNYTLTTNFVSQVLVPSLEYLRVYVAASLILFLLC